MFEKNGVVGRKKVGDAICVRGDCLLPFSLLEVGLLYYLLKCDEWMI